MAEALSDQALLNELNGALKTLNDQGPKDLGLHPGDPALEQPRSLGDQLETAKVIAPASKRMILADKSHSKASGGNGFRVIVRGQYYAKSTETKGNVVKEYEISFNLPSLTNSKGDSALGIIVGRLLKPALIKKDPLAITFKTHEISSVIPLNGAPEPTSILYMSFDALKAYVRKTYPDFPVDVDTYIDVTHLREDVIDFKTNMVSEVIENPGTQAETRVMGGFGLKKTPTDRILARQAERLEQAELVSMNEGVLS